MKTFDQPEVATEIMRRLTKLEPNSPRKWGKMTAHQAICHLTDSLEGIIGKRNMSYPPSPKFQQAIMRWGSLYLPIPWPKGIKTAIELDQQQQGTSPTEFARDKAKLLGVCQDIAAHRTQWIEAHPILGKMTEREWQRFEYLHFDHHLRQFGV